MTGRDKTGGVPRHARGWVVAGVVVVALAGTAVGAYRLGASSVSVPPSETPVTLAAQPIDVGFAADMSDHHAQAVQMALLALDKSSNPAIRTLAVEITSSQRREAGRLDQFLRDRGIERTDPTRTVMAWMGEPVPHDRMPGLATSEQLVALTNAQGSEFDDMFLRLMRAHHDGGVHMATFAASSAESQQIRDLAAAMVVQQRREIGEIDQLLGG